MRLRNLSQHEILATRNGSVAHIRRRAQLRQQRSSLCGLDSDSACKEIGITPRSGITVDRRWWPSSGIRQRNGSKGVATLWDSSRTCGRRWPHESGKYPEHASLRIILERSSRAGGSGSRVGRIILDLASAAVLCRQAVRAETRSVPWTPRSYGRRAATGSDPAAKSSLGYEVRRSRNAALGWSQARSGTWQGFDSALAVYAGG